MPPARVDAFAALRVSLQISYSNLEKFINSRGKDFDKNSTVKNSKVALSAKTESGPAGKNDLWWCFIFPLVPMGLLILSLWYFTCLHPHFLGFKPIKESPSVKFCVEFFVV